jgi:putative transposase
MLTNNEFEQLMVEQGMPEAGVRLITQARKDSPVRQVKSTGKNVITMVSSRKMGRSIATESRMVEYRAAIEHELNPLVVEYFAQPGTYKLEAIDQVTAEIHAFEHTPDFLIVQKNCVKLQEWKTEEKLASLALKFPWRYQKFGDQWRSPQIEAHFASLGIAYEIHSAASIHPNRTKNWEILFDYFDSDTPSPTKKTTERLRAALQNHGSLSLLDLQSEPFSFQADDLLKSIVEGHLACDLDAALLSDIYNFRVYRDGTLVEFEKSISLGRATEFENNFAVTLAPGTRYQFDGRLLELAVVGETELVFNSLDDKTSRTLSREWLISAVKHGHIKQVGNGSNLEGTNSLHPLLVHTQQELAQAQLKAQFLDMPYDEKHTPFSKRTYFRLKAAQAQAAANGGHEILALASNNYKKGNRQSRLTADQLAAMHYLYNTAYKTNAAKRVKSVYRELQVYCRTNSVPCPSYPTFCNFIKNADDHSTRQVRYGNRMAYQEAQFYYSLSYDTPVHGVRPFEYVHIDHTLVDIELRCRRTGNPLGRPWLTFMVDAYSRRVMAFHLGFHQPSRSEVLMCFRAFVKRWSRIPFMTICDNGKDLIASDVETMVQSLGGHFRRRPKGQPRVGSVMERMFGTANTQLFHNLDGNTKLTKNVRMLSSSHLPERLANWSLGDLSKVIEHWAYSFYDNERHPALDMSPREAYAKGQHETGHRPHKMIAFCDDFLIVTCPSVDRCGMRKVDRQRGVKVHNFYYQSPLFDSLRLNEKSVPVRFDPNDIGRVFFQLPTKEWAQARSMQLAHLPRLNSRQLQAISDEYRKIHRLSTKTTEISGERLIEFIATLKPDSPVAEVIQLAGETEQLQDAAGLLPSNGGGVTRKAFGFGDLQRTALSQVCGVEPKSSERIKRSSTNKRHAHAVQSAGLVKPSGNDEFDFGELD